MAIRPSNTFSLSRRIGSTTYKVTIHFSNDATETMEDKILRLIRNEADTNEPKCGTMDVPQMSRPA